MGLRANTSLNGATTGVAHLDNAQTLFFQRELEYVYAKPFEVLRANLKARLLFPVNSEVPPWADRYVYKVLDRVGQAKMIQDYATDLPTVELIGKEVVAKIHDYGISYVYSIKEILAAMHGGFSLDGKKSEFAAKAVAEKENRLAFFGDASLNIVGVLNHPNIPTASVANGAAASPLWNTKTPDEILKDLNDSITQMMTFTKGVETPDTLVLPISSHRYISATRVSAIDSKSILQAFLENNPMISEVMTITELESLPVGTAGAGLKGFFVYKKDPMKIEMVVPKEFTQEAPQQTNLAFRVPCYASYGGLAVYYPFSLRLSFGI